MNEDIRTVSGSGGMSYRRGHTRLPLDMTGHIWALMSVEPHPPPPQSSLCAKDPIILPAEATELSRASASDLDN